MTADLWGRFASGVISLVFCPLHHDPSNNIFCLGWLERLLSRRPRPFSCIFEPLLVIRWSEFGLSYAQTLQQERRGLGTTCQKVFDDTFRMCLFAPTFSLHHLRASCLDLLFDFFKILSALFMQSLPPYIDRFLDTWILGKLCRHLLALTLWSGVWSWVFENAID